MSRDDLARETLRLVDIASESRNEAEILDYLQERMDETGRRPLHRGDGILFYGPEPSAIVLAGHVDTVPAQDNLPGRLTDDEVVGLGATDMKGALAVMLALASDPEVDAGFLFFAREEIPITESALLPMLKLYPPAKRIELAVVMEPTDNAVEVGCLGNLNATAVFSGVSAHSARPWHGENAAHAAIEGLVQVASFEPREVTVGGLVYREVVNVTNIEGGLARNVLPDVTTAHLNFRYAPGRTPGEAEEELAALVPGATLQVIGNAPPGPVPFDNPFVSILGKKAGSEPRPKQAWTPVAEFGMHGIDAINFGPGDPALAHTKDESVRIDALERSESVLREFLTAVADI